MNKLFLILYFSTNVQRVEMPTQFKTVKACESEGKYLVSKIHRDMYRGKIGVGFSCAKGHFDE